MREEFKRYTEKELLKRCGLDAPPVDLFRICHFLNITVIDDSDFDRLDTISELISAGELNEIVVWLNPFSYESERRFALAKEIGYLMTTKRVDFDRSIRKTSKREFHGRHYSNTADYVAGEYAESLLMPSNMVQVYGQKMIDEYNERGFGRITLEAFVSKMAELFEVSRKDMVNRLQRLGVINPNS